MYHFIPYNSESFSDSLILVCEVFYSQRMASGVDLKEIGCGLVEGMHWRVFSQVYILPWRRRDRFELLKRSPYLDIQKIY